MANQNGMLQVLLSRLQNNPNFKNNPQAQEMLNVILTGDSKRGEELANQILQQNGVSREEGVNKARSFFGQMMTQQNGGPKRR